MIDGVEYYDLLDKVYCHYPFAPILYSPSLKQVEANGWVTVEAVKGEAVLCRLTDEGNQQLDRLHRYIHMGDAAQRMKAWARALDLDVSVFEYTYHTVFYLLQDGPVKVAESWVSTQADVADLFDKWRSGNFESVSQCGKIEDEW